MSAPALTHDAVRHHRTKSTLVQIMACCLMAPSHYLNADLSITYFDIRTISCIVGMDFKSFMNTAALLWLTQWGQVTHICVGNLTIIDPDNGLSPGRRQAIFKTNAGILLIEPLRTNFSEISIEIRRFSFKEMHLKMSSGKRPFCLGLNVLTINFCYSFQMRAASTMTYNFVCIVSYLLLPCITLLAQVEARVSSYQEDLSQLLLFQQLQTAVKEKPHTQLPSSPQDEQRRPLLESIILADMKHTSSVILGTSVDGANNGGQDTFELTSNVTSISQDVAADVSTSEERSDSFHQGGSQSDISVRAKRARYDERTCEVICRTCALHMSRRWSALCSTQCSEDGGHAMDACLMVVAILARDPANHDIDRSLQEKIFGR